MSAVAAAIVGGAAITAVAASNAANQQAGIANDQLSWQEQNSQKALGLAQPSFQDLQQIQQQYTMSNQLLTTQIGQLQQQQALYNNINSQANTLLNGGSNISTTAYGQERQLQQQQEQNDLKAQLGSGYAGSSAGIDAMNNFNLQTALGQSQIGTQYAQMAGQLGSQITAGYNQTYQAAGNLNAQGLSADAQNRQMQVGALTGNQPNFNNSIATAGAPYAGMASVGSSLATAGGLFANSGGGNGGGFNPDTYGGLNGSTNLTLPQLGAPQGNAGTLK